MKRVGVIFPGQGSQVVGMGVSVAASSEAAMHCFRLARHIVGYDLFALCADGSDAVLRETRYAQPAIFVTNVALYAAVGELLDPVVSAGHSFGEFCSLTIAGALAFETALTLVHERALAMDRAAQESDGTMAAVLGLDSDRLRAVAAAATHAGPVNLANFNAPGQIVISGASASVEAVGAAALAAGAKRVVRLNVAGAWHSELMNSARIDFARKVANAAIALPRFTVLSNVDARPYRDVETIRAHLERSITGEVRWHEVSLAMISMELDLIVEFGASAVLAPLLKRVDGAPPTRTVKDVADVEDLRATLTTRVRA